MESDYCKRSFWNRDETFRSGLPYMTSAKVLDFFTLPPPLSEFYELHVLKFGVFSDPPPPSVRTSYMEAPLQ